MSDTQAELPVLLTFEEVAGLLRLARTAARERLAKDDAPEPICLNARVYRWDAAEIAVWLKSLRVPHPQLPGMTRTHKPTRRGGRPRKHV